MSCKRIIFCVCVLFASLTGWTQTVEQTPLTNDTASVNKLLRESKKHLGDDPAKSISLAIQAKEMAEKIDFPLGRASAFKNIGLGYYFQGKFLETLEYWNESLKIFEELKDDLGVANLLNNIAAVYADQGAEEKALEYSLRSLKISEQKGDKLRILSALNTIASIYFNKPATMDKALDYLLRALPLCDELGDKASFGVLAENIGEIYFKKGDDTKALDYFNRSIMALGNTANSPFAYNGIGKIYLKKGDFTKALEYHQTALTISEKTDGKAHIVRSLQGIANVYLAEKNYTSALNYFNKATTIAQEIKLSQELKDLYGEMAKTYDKSGDYFNAFKYQTLFSNIKDTIYNIDTDKKLGSLQFDFDLQKKQGEINLLTKDKDLADLRIKRQKLAQWALAIGLGLVLMITLLIFRSYRVKAKTNKILDKQKDEIEGLLLNILPSEVAKELQLNGTATPRNYESVSVMFTDFKGFTTIADKKLPRDLVEELNTCFMVFDGIMEKYGLEKIKTIGDSYMCAGGIPTPEEGHIFKMIKASLEIRDYMAEYNVERVEMGLEPWYLRIGIHSGPIVAGVVGKKKYAYDIWGTTVNIASRMESNGEPGKVNISSAVHEMIKDHYDCIHRGKIFAKNVGEIDMYFVGSEKIPGIEQDIRMVDSSATQANIEAGS